MEIPGIQNENIHLEQKETELKPFATFYIVRHGESEYKEEFQDPEVLVDLTEKGKKQIKKLASLLNIKSEPDEPIYVMSSPRTRALNTAEILKDNLGKAGHNVVELGKGRPSLSNVKMLNEEGKNIYDEKDKSKYLSDMAGILDRIKLETDYYIKSRKGALEKPVTESVEDYRKKVKTILRRLVEIARQRQGNNEKLILATHGEWLDTLLESYFDRKIEKNEDSAPKGGMVEIKILADKLVFSFENQEIIIDG